MPLGMGTEIDFLWPRDSSIVPPHQSVFDSAIFFFQRVYQKIEFAVPADVFASHKRSRVRQSIRYLKTYARWELGNHVPHI